MEVTNTTTQHCRKIEEIVCKNTKREKSSPSSVNWRYTKMMESAWLRFSSELLGSQLTATSIVFAIKAWPKIILLVLRNLMMKQTTTLSKAMGTQPWPTATGSSPI